MRFTKENVEKVIDEYFWQADFEPCGDLIAEIHNLDDTPEKVAVPKFVADVFSSELHFEYEIQESRDIPHVLSAAFSEVSSNKNIKFLQWVKQHPDKYVMAVKYGYEVEKEPLYCVNINGQYLVKMIPERNVHKFVEEVKLCVWDTQAYQLTEAEIKAIDERYTTFMVPVDEEKQ